MPRTQPWFAVLGLVALALAGCGDPDEKDVGVAALNCQPGAAQLCLCAESEERGSQICAADGSRYSPCECGFEDLELPTDGPNNGTANNGSPNNGGANNGANNGGNNAAVNNGANNGAVNNGANNGANNGGPATCEVDEDCESCGGAEMCRCAAVPNFEGLRCLPGCEVDEDCPPGIDDEPLVCDPRQGLCVPER